MQLCIDASRALTTIRPMRLIAPAPASPSRHRPESATDPTRIASSDVTVLVLAQMPASSRLWGWSRFVLGPSVVGHTTAPRLVKILGSGFDGGFGLRPSGTRQGLLCVFDGEDAARSFIHASVVDGYRRRADEFLLALLQPFSVRGTWSGKTLEHAPPRPDDAAAPVAAITRASIRPSRALAFWRQAPAAQAGLADAAGCRLAVGLGEAPLLRQATFSVWDNQAAMDTYARQGPHLAAIRDAQRLKYFSESMFVRFRILQLSGTYKGVQYG